MNYLAVQLAGVACAALALLLSSETRAASPDVAAIMPQAVHSLQLDVTRAGSRLVSVGERGIILYSDDEGDNWQQARVPTTRMLTCVHFVDARRGWAAGHDGLILVSDDAGENWRIQRDGLAAQHQTNLEIREAAYRQLEQLNQRLETADQAARRQVELALQDAQMDLEDAELTLQEPVFTSPIIDIWFQDADRGWAVGAFNTLVMTDDGGQHWRSVAEMLDNPDEFHLNAITGDGQGRIFIAGEGGVMYRSIDSGRSWESLAPFYEGSWFGVVYSHHGDMLLMFGLRGNLYRSSDFGTTWVQIHSDNNSTLAGGSVSTNGELVVVGGTGSVLLSADGGQSFRLTTMADRLSLSAGLSVGGKLILVGQGGIKTHEGTGHEQ